MAKTKILKEGWGAAPNTFYVSAMRTTDNRCGGMETENTLWLQMAKKDEDEHTHLMYFDMMEIAE